VNWTLFATVFATVFLAELGDKTQLATVLYASREDHGRLTVFLGAALALVLSTAIGVLAGGLLGRHLGGPWLARLAGLGFVAVGIWTIWRA